MLLEDIKLNLRTARSNRTATKNAAGPTSTSTKTATASASATKSRSAQAATAQSTATGVTAVGGSVVRASAPRGEFRAWRAGRPFAGAVLTIIAGIEMFFSSQLDLGNIHVQVGIEGLQSTIIPAIMVTVGLLTLFNPSHRLFYGVISLVVAVYSLVGLNLGGFFIGMLLGAIGGILVVSWIAKPAKGIDDNETEAHESPVATGPELAAEPRPLAHSRS